MVRPARKLRIGEHLLTSDGSELIEVGGRTEAGDTSIVTVLGFREWETRHLAWLAAMIFAFTSFRAAAPGSPPIGVYFDFASFFWAELIVAVGLATMVVKYLVGRDIPGADGGSGQDGPIDAPIDEPGPARSGRLGLGPPS